MSDDPPINRRRFFREGLRGLFDNIGRAAGPLQRMLHELEGVKAELGSLAAKESATPQEARSEKPNRLRILRPPGAKHEEEFLRTCSTCGNCVSACPVNAIHIEPGKAGGAPFIIAEDQPCTLCDGLNCMYSCPSGAILPVPIGLIDMGTAQWKPDRCLRTQGTECTMCVDRCPIGPKAIELRDGNVAVHPDGCTGCGVCEHECPTSPRAIVVIPR
jgi:MauM/NapG family ferredoxin protein